MKELKGNFQRTYHTRIDTNYFSLFILLFYLCRAKEDELALSNKIITTKAAPAAKYEFCFEIMTNNIKMIEIHIFYMII